MKLLKILNENKAINKNNNLYNVGWYLGWSIGDKLATLDGEFDAQELEAIACFMKHADKL